MVSNLQSGINQIPSLCLSWPAMSLYGENGPNKVLPLCILTGNTTNMLSFCYTCLALFSQCCLNIFSTVTYLLIHDSLHGAWNDWFLCKALLEKVVPPVRVNNINHYSCKKRWDNLLKMEHIYLKQLVKKARRPSQRQRGQRSGLTPISVELWSWHFTDYMCLSAQWAWHINWT